MTETAPFFHLHAHSEHSKLDGATTFKELVPRLKELGMPGVALTDHGVMQGLSVFYKTLRKEGLKPILGLEAYVTTDRHVKVKGSPTYHLTLLAETTEGYHNLCKLSTLAFTEGFYSKPRMDWASLSEYHEGIIALTGCMAGAVMRAIFDGNLTTARAEVERLVDIFGHANVYGEIQNVGIEENRTSAWSELALKLGKTSQADYDRYLANRDEWQKTVDEFPQTRLRERERAEKKLATVEARRAVIRPDAEKAVPTTLKPEYETLGLEAEALRQQMAELAAEARPYWAAYDELNKAIPLSQTEANRELAAICADLDIPLVGTGDVHYLRKEDALSHDAITCVGIGMTQADPKRTFSLLPKHYHLRSREEMAELLAEWPEALDNTVKVAERCNAEIIYADQAGLKLPRYPLPEGDTDSAEYLRKLAYQGLLMRLGLTSADDIPEDYRARIEFELDTIIRMGFPDYFLITWDMYNEARQRNLPHGPGRGSAAGSLVAYCLEITQLDPIAYGLLFERFLNPGRKSMPDIDNDFGVEARVELMAYVKEKYNLEAARLNNLAECISAVVQIITFGTFAAKGALLAAAKVLADPNDPEGTAKALILGRRLSNMVPEKPPSCSLEEALKISEQLAAAAKSTDPLTRKVIELAKYFDGRIAQNGKHAAAVIIADHPLEWDLPLQVITGDIATQYDMRDSEELGLLKMDFLGLRNLDVIWNTIERLQYTRGIEPFSPWSIPLDDAPTYELFARAETVGTFQFEGSGIRQALAEVKPTELNDLIALVALYRPGPMKHIPTYAARKHGREPVSYPDPRLEEVLAETWGLTVFQEQSMRISRILAGFSEADADDLRKAIGKKLREKMDALKPKYIAGCLANGVSKTVAEYLWKDNEDAADYSFNKSHAACYALIAYITGYLKVHYPEEYMASLLASVRKHKSKPRLYLSEARRMGLSVLPPDLNRSKKDFAVVERDEQPGSFDILFGLRSLKNVGAAVEPLIVEREQGGMFASLYDLVRRRPGELNKRVADALIQGGALDSTGATRKILFEHYEQIVKDETRRRGAREREFVNAVKARVESAPEGDARQLALIEAPGKRRKLSGELKLAVETIAKIAAVRHAMPSLDEAVEAVSEAFRKDAMTIARRQAKEELASTEANGEHEVGIANEEAGGGEELTPNKKVELRAAEIVQPGEKARRQQASTLASQILTFVEAELGQRADDDGFAAALGEEIDPPLKGEEWEYLEKLNRERAVLGIYVTGHPLDRQEEEWCTYIHKLSGSKGREIADLCADDIGQEVRIVGAVVGRDDKKTKTGSVIFKPTIEDLTGAIEVTVFPKTVDRDADQKALMEVGTLVCVEARVEEDTFARDQAERAAASDDGGSAEVEEEDESAVALKLTAIRFFPWQPEAITQKLDAARAAQPAPSAPPATPPAAAAAPAAPAPAPEAPAPPQAAPAPPQASAVAAVRITVDAHQFNADWINRLRAICAEYPGEVPVRIACPDKEYPLKTGPNGEQITISPVAGFAAAVRALKQAADEAVAAA